MKVGIITTPNTKGQIVIPQRLRKAIGILPRVPVNLVVRGRGLYLYPVAEVWSPMETEDTYLKVLERTKGTWGKRVRLTNPRHRSRELAASRQRKQVW